MIMLNVYLLQIPNKHLKHVLVYKILTVET